MKANGRYLKVIDHFDPIIMVREPLEEFMYYAHRNPETKFILGDFRKSFALTEEQKEKLPCSCIL
jgi:hypothetical protein